ncbi:hypothetical protein EPUS_01057 [Endocarpon pusillum Z07020]|uniref:Uncharacterized protein n=1 Tax=Endocarpon pusillum (strain Z07020 / HMAS-L-300199) TaxID=1263415 RepID=U1GBN6_ENDPU|nr:uncharacterized protein EPUS_01057 [Endocarpon pusillum Z07020]ERF69101.1 hypothetical protein EPUS_01057 [Endocarpon pusillum Z07020]
MALYSGVAAVHQILIFDSAPEHRGTFNLRGISASRYQLHFANIHGLDDQDRDTACRVVGAALLAILHMAMWSMVFKKAAARPIFVLWMPLMASSHVFCADLPGLAYQATEQTDVFRTTYSDIASNTQKQLREQK